MVTMRTAAECLAKAADMERLAETCDAGALKTSWLYMALCWRDVARMAAWQDGPA
jgi:hypothetical protein